MICGTMNCQIPSVDSLEVTILADNYTHMFKTQDTGVTCRPKFMPPHTLLAEHGFSCILKSRKGSDEKVVLLDGGVNPECIIHNGKLLKIDLSSVDVIALSHGHPDHFLGLYGLIKLMKGRIPIMIHPDVYLERRLNNPVTGPVSFPRLDNNHLISSGAVPSISRNPRMIDDHFLMTGEIERRIAFEKGFLWAEAKIGDKWIVDPFIDEQALVINVKDKGLVIISGCAHAGIINTIKHAQNITGICRVHAVLGGFHLTGPLFEPIIRPTINEMKLINPDYVVPMHCTGWEATQQFRDDMPGKCILNTVGTKYTF